MPAAIAHRPVAAGETPGATMIGAPRWAAEATAQA